MKLGLFTMPLHPPHRKHADTFDEDMEFMVLADQLGFEEAWIGEHTATTWENIPVPEMFIVQALEHSVSTVFHHRIDYPGFDFNRERPRRRTTETGTTEAAGPRAV